jgi:hypothetical protein
MQEYPLNQLQELIEIPEKISAFRETFMTQAFLMGSTGKTEEELECFITIDETSYPPSQELVGFNGFIKHLIDGNAIIKEIDKTVLALLDDKKKEYYLKTTLNTITHLEQLLYQRDDLKKYTSIEDTLIAIKESIIAKYNLPVHESSIVDAKKANPKIQWLGKTNILTTLLFDLWQGQSKGSKKAQTKPLIKAQKKDLMDLLLNNFIDADGNPLKESTISDYLNTSEEKSTSKAKLGVRIELPE